MYYKIFLFIKNAFVHGVNLHNSQLRIELKFTQYKQTFKSELLWDMNEHKKMT